MYRRELVAATAVALGGCLGSASSPEADAEDRARTASVASENAPAASTVLEYGDWYEATLMSVRVTDVSTIRALEMASTPENELPPDTELAILAGEIENTSDSRLDFAEDVDISLALVAGNGLFRPATEQRSGDGGASIDISQIEIGSGTHLSSGEAQLTSGERVSVWQAVLIPASLSTDEVQTTMCGANGDCAVRWKPASKTCDCPG